MLNCFSTKPKQWIMDYLKDYFVKSFNYFSKILSSNPIKRLPTPGFFSALVLIGVTFAFTSCEEENPTTGWEGESSVLGHYTYETSTMYAIKDEHRHIHPGSLPFLSSDEGTFDPESVMLLVPGRVMAKMPKASLLKNSDQATEEQGIDPANMLAVFPVSKSERPLTLKEREEIPPDLWHGNEPIWWKFNGSQFFPDETFTPGDDGLEVPGDEWMPENLGDMEILVYNGTQSSGELFGDVDWSEHTVENGSVIETEKEQLAVAVPFDRLTNLKMEPRFNLAEVLYENPDKIAFPTDTSGKDFVDPKPTAIFLSPPEASNSNPEATHPLISGKNFFPDETFVPSTVSVFTIPVKELFPDETFSAYQSSVINSDKRLLLFGSDHFTSAPAGWTNHEPGAEINVSNTYVIMSNSVLDIHSGLMHYIGPNRLNINGADGESYWPEDFYYPNEFEFRDETFAPGSEFAFIRPGSKYSAAMLFQMGMEVNLDQEPGNY